MLVCITIIMKTNLLYVNYYFMSKLSNILKQLMVEEKVNTTDVARATGILQPVMHRIVNGVTDDPRTKTILPIAKFFNVSVDQLMGVIPLPINRKSCKNTGEKWSRLPIINWDDINKHLTDKKIPGDDKYVETDAPISSRSYALIVKDSTMHPVFQEGNILFVDPEVEAENNDYVIVMLESQPVFKQILFDGASRCLKPLNPDFKTVFIDKENEITHLGVVIENRMRLK